MSKGDREGFIVKFVDSKGQKTEYAVKAYEVNSIKHHLAQICCCWWLYIFCFCCCCSTNVCVMSLHRPFWSCSLKSTWKASMRMLFCRWTTTTSLCLSSAASPPRPFCTAKRSESVSATSKPGSWISQELVKCNYFLSHSFVVVFFVWCSLAAGWWVRWWCCTACRTSIVSPKQRSPSITWPWRT